MNQQSSSVKREQLVLQNNDNKQNLHIVSTEELVYEKGQIFSGKHMENKKSGFNFYQQDNYNEQLLETKGQNNDTLYNLTNSDYNHQTQVVGSSQNLNVNNLDTQLSTTNRQRQLSKQIITSDMRSRLKNKNNIRNSMQSQVEGINSPLSITVRSNQNKDDKEQDNNKKLFQETDQYFQNTHRITSRNELYNECKSPNSDQQTQRGLIIDNTSILQSAKLQQSNHLKDDSSERKQESRIRARTNYAETNSQQIIYDDNIRVTEFKRREHKNDTHISGNKVFPDKIKQNQSKQLSVFSQQSIQNRNEEDQRNLTLRVPGLRFTPQLNNQVHPTKKENNNQQQSPNQKIENITNSQKNQPKSQPLISQQTPQKLSKIGQSKSSKGFFSFFGRKFGQNNSNQNTPQNSSVNTFQNLQLNQQNSGYQANLTLNSNLNNMNNPNNLNQNMIGNTANQPVQEINPGTNWNFVKKLAKVKKFIDSIKTSNLYQSFYKVKMSHLDLISDKSDYTVVIDNCYDKSKSNHFGNEAQIQMNRIASHYSLYSSFISSIENLSEYIPLFLPHHLFLNCYKVVMLVISLMTLVYVPLKGSFGLFVEIGSPEFYILFLFPFLFFILEIFISFNTAYYEEGDIQINRLKIIQYYLKSTFFIDLISTIACYFLYIEQRLYFGFFIMIRLFKIGSYRREINEYFYIQQRANTAYTLVNLIFTFILVAHYFACGFNYIAVIEEDYYCIRSWVTASYIGKDNWLSRYINSIYFSIITMVTVGFGDILPVNDAEKVYVTVVALISSLIFAYTVNTIGTVFQEIAQQEAEYKSQKYHLSVYMRSRSINQQLQTRVMKYLDHMIHKQLESPEKGQEILKKMQKKIRDEIYKDFFGKILTNSKMFKFNFSEAFLKDLTIQMKEIICRPGEIIYSFNEVDNRIFFINKGEVELFLEKYQNKDDQDNYSYDVMTKGDIFGELSFFTSKMRETSAKSLTVSHLIYCTSEDFIQVIKQYPKDHEKFCQMKDEITNYGGQLNTRCAVCQKFRHSIVDCPYVHLKRSRENVIHKHIRSIPNERTKHLRIKRVKINTFQINEKVKIKLRKIRKIYVSKANKKIKDDDNNVLLDDNKAGYFINVKKSGDSDQSIDSILSENHFDLKKLSDKKFFLQTPKIYRDQHQQICIQNEDEEFIDEDDDFQNDSQDILNQDDQDDDDSEDDDDDEDEDDDDEDDNEDDDDDILDDEDDNENDEDKSDDDSDEDQNENEGQSNIIDEKNIMKNQNRQEMQVETPQPGQKESIFKAFDKARKLSENLNRNALKRQNKEDRSSMDNLQTYSNQKSSNQKLDDIDDFNMNDLKRVVPSPPSIKFHYQDQSNIPPITLLSKDNEQSQKNQTQKYYKMNLTVSPGSPNSTAIKSNQTSNIHLQSEKGFDTRIEQENFQNSSQSYNKNQDQVEETSKNNYVQFDTNSKQDMNQQGNMINQFNQQHSTSFADQIDINNKINNHRSSTEQYQQKETENLQTNTDKQLQQPKQNVTSIERYQSISLEETDKNQILSLTHIPRQLNFQQKLDKQLSSLKETLSEQEKSKNINEQNEGDTDLFLEENQFSQNIKSFEDNDPTSQISINSNLIEQNKSSSKKNGNKEESGKKSQKIINIDDKKNNEANDQLSGIIEQKNNKRNKNQVSYQQQKVNSYKLQNKLIFKDSIFSLKIAGISNKSQTKISQNIKSKRKQSTINSQLTFGSYEVLDDLNTSQHHLSLGQLKEKDFQGRKLKSEKQNQDDKEIKSEKNTEISNRRKSKKDEKLDEFIPPAHSLSSRDYSKPGRIFEERKQKKRNSYNLAKIDTQQIQQKNRQLLVKQNTIPDQLLLNLQSKVDKSLDSGKSSRSSSQDIKNVLKRNLLKQDSIKVRRSTQSNKAIDIPSILKSKKTINIVNDQQILPQIIMTPQTSRPKLQRKSTIRSETPRNSIFSLINDQELFATFNKRKERKKKLLTTIISPTLEAQKATSRAGSLLPPPNGNLLHLPLQQESGIQNDDLKDKKFPLKRKGTKNDPYAQNNSELLQIPINLGLGLNNSGGNTVTSNTNSFGLQTNKSSVVLNQVLNSSFSVNNHQQQNHSLLKPSNFKSQNDFSSAWLQVQQQQQIQLQQTQSKQNQQQIPPPTSSIHLLQVPSQQHYQFQNNENHIIASPILSQTTVPRPSDSQQQSSPHNSYRKQISMNYSQNNHQLFTMSPNNPHNPQQIGQKPFHHSQSLKQILQPANGQNQQTQLHPNAQPQLQNHQQIQSHQQTNPNQQNAQPQQQLTQQLNQLQPPSSQHQIQYQNYQQFQHMQTLPVHMQMNMMMNTQNPTFYNNNHYNENNYMDQQYINNYDYQNQKTLFLYDFDRMKEFTNYFPHNNYSIVCKEKKKIVNRKNYFTSKKMGNSSRNIMVNKVPMAHPSPRVQTGLLGVSNNFNASFRGTSNKIGSQNMNASDKLHNHNANNNGSQSNINTGGNSNPGSFTDKGKGKLKRATESLITNKRNSFMVNSKRNIRATDNPAITNFNNSSSIPKNITLQNIGTLESEMKNMENSLELKTNLLNIEKQTNNQHQSEEKNNDTPEIEFTNQNKNYVQQREKKFTIS